MPLQPNGPAPYTSVAAVATVLDAWRDRGFGVPVTTDTLTRVGVGESLARRTFQSLVGLDLLREDGTPTDQFGDFRSTRGEDEYRTRVAEWVRSVYADVLQYADPASDPYDRVTEAFRTYEPAGQRRAMAALLLGLWKYAGLPVPNTTTNGPAPARPRPTKATRKPGARSEARGRAKPVEPVPSLGADGLPPGLIGLLGEIPQKGASWTSLRRDAFLTTFEVVLNFSVPVDDNPAVEVSEPDEDDP